MLFLHFEPTGHSIYDVLKDENVGKIEVEDYKELEGLEESEYKEQKEDTTAADVDAKYRNATSESAGGQSSDPHNQPALPPYISKESPEEANWLRLHPEGWHEPPSHPYGPYPQPDNGDNDDNDSNGKRRKTKRRRGHAARTGDGAALARELKRAQIENEKERVIHERDDYGWQLIHDAVLSGNEQVVEVLLENGADVNSRTLGGRGATPLFLALKTFGEEHSIVRYLKSLGALNVAPEGERRTAKSEL